VERRAGMPDQPLAYLWMRVGHIVVDDGVLLERVEEANELLVAINLGWVRSSAWIWLFSSDQEDDRMGGRINIEADVFRLKSMAVRPFTTIPDLMPRD
jgi:hypothetical protein